MPCYKSPFCVFWACNRKKRLPKVSSIYIRCTSGVYLAHYDREALHLELGGLCDDQNHCWSIAGGRTCCRSNAVLLILYVLRKCLSSDGHFYNISVESLPCSTSKPINNLFINLADLCKIRIGSYCIKEKHCCFRLLFSLLNCVGFYGVQTVIYQWLKRK